MFWNIQVDDPDIEEHGTWVFVLCGDFSHPFKFDALNVRYFVAISLICIIQFPRGSETFFQGFGHHFAPLLRGYKKP